MGVIQLTLAFFSSLVLALILVPILTRGASIFNVLGGGTGPSISNDPEAWRKVNKAPVPLIGGPAIIIGFLVSYFAFSIDGAYLDIILTSLIVFTVGLIDEVWSISPRIRILIQALCAIFIVWNADLAASIVSIAPTTIFNIPY